MRRKLLKTVSLSLFLSTMLLSGCSDKIDDGMKKTSVDIVEESKSVGFGGDSNAVYPMEVVVEETTTSSLQSLNKPLELEVKEVKEDKKVSEITKIDLITSLNLATPYDYDKGEEKQYNYFKLELPENITYAGFEKSGPTVNSLFYMGNVKEANNFVLATLSSIDFISEGLIEDGEVVSFDKLEEQERIDYLKKFNLDGVSGMTPYNIYSLKSEDGLPFHIIDFVSSDNLYGSVGYSIKNNICFISMIMSDISIGRTSDLNDYLISNSVFNMEPLSDDLNIPFERFEAIDNLTIENKRELDGYEKKVLSDELSKGQITINGYKFTMNETTVADIERFNYSSKEIDDTGIYYSIKVDDSNELCLVTDGSSEDSKLVFLSLDYHLDNDNLIQCDLIPFFSTYDLMEDILDDSYDEFMDSYSFELNDHLGLDIITSYYMDKELITGINLLSY